MVQYLTVGTETDFDFFGVYEIKPGPVNKHPLLLLLLIMKYYHVFFFLEINYP